MSLRKQRRIEQLQRELNELLGIRKRSLRAIGPTPAGARQQGEMRRRGRIFGCLPAAAAAECESACGLTNSQIAAETAYHGEMDLCFQNYNAGAVIRTVTLNLAAAASVVIMAAIIPAQSLDHANFQIKRDGTNVTDQAASRNFGRYAICADTGPSLIELEACESLAAGNYTWNLTTIAFRGIFASWMKAREITCIPV